MHFASFWRVKCNNKNHQEVALVLILSKVDPFAFDDHEELL